MPCSTVYRLTATLTLLLVSISCGADGANGSGSIEKPMPTVQSANGSASQSPSTDIEKRKSNNIRDVDFKNLKYPWYPSYLKAPQGTREVKLQNGNFEVKEDQRTGIKNLILELGDVSYANLSANEEIAIVTLSGVSVFNRFVGCVFIFASERQNPRVLWQREIGDRADGGLRRVAVEGHTLIIEQYERSEGDGGLCCPTQFVRRYFSFDRSRLKQTKSETLSNEYPNARFLGYPSERP